MTPRGFATTHASAIAGGDLQKVGGDLYQRSSVPEELEEFDETFVD